MSLFERGLRSRNDEDRFDTFVRFWWSRVRAAGRIGPDRIEEDVLVVAIAGTMACAGVIHDKIAACRVMADDDEHMRDGSRCSEVRIAERAAIGGCEDEISVFDFRDDVFDGYVVDDPDVFIIEVFSDDRNELREAHVLGMIESRFFEFRDVMDGIRYRVRLGE